MLTEILKAEGRAIAEEFSLASKQGNGTPQEIADFREHAVQSFFQRFLPQSHIVSKGKITDLSGNQSDSIDCLVLNPAHPNLIDSHGKFRLIFSDGCDTAIEVKPNLCRTDELIRAAVQCQSVKKTKRSESPLLLRSRKPKNLIDHSCYVPFVVFSVRAFEPEKIYDILSTYYSTNEIPVEEQIDLIVISQSGIIRNVKHAELNYYGAPSPIGKSTGWYFETWEDATLLGMLLCMEHFIPGVAGMSESIMRRVLTKNARFSVKLLGEGK